MGLRKNYLVRDNRSVNGTVIEVDMVTCKHCQAQLRVVRGEWEAGPSPLAIEFRPKPSWRCHQCFGPICEACQRKGVCDPFLKQVERVILENAKVIW